MLSRMRWWRLPFWQAASALANCRDDHAPAMMSHRHLDTTYYVPDCTEPDKSFDFFKVLVPHNKKNQELLCMMQRVEAPRDHTSWPDKAEKLQK